jgi:hypothetical protein
MAGIQAASGQKQPQVWPDVSATPVVVTSQWMLASTKWKSTKVDNIDKPSNSR